MSSTKYLNRYSNEWRELCSWMSHMDNQHTVTTVECETEKAAKAMRLEFYKVRDLYRKTEADATEAERQECFEVWGVWNHNNLDTREVRVEGTKVIFGLKGENTLSKSIAAHLEKLNKGEV